MMNRRRAMVTFLVVFLAIYGGSHAYIWWKMRQAFHPSGAAHAGLVLFLLLMMAGPILSRNLEQAGKVGVARPLALVSYVWMAVVLWALFLGLAADIWNLIVRLAVFVAPGARSLAIPPRPAALVALVLILAAIGFGWRSARHIRPTHLILTTPLLAPGSRPVRLAQISDVHVGLLVGEGRLQKIAAIVREERPDILVSTGDLVDGSTSSFNHLADILAALDPPLGKFAVTGNHEYYAWLEGALAFTRASGFRLLRGERIKVGPILLAGVDDPAGRLLGKDPRAQETGLLPETGKKEFCLLLKHRPDVEPGSPGRFDLQLSGHTHRGQIWPFTYLVALTHRYLSGFFDLGGGASLYVSRGTGTWGPPLRLFAPPEVTLVEIRPQ